MCRSLPTEKAGRKLAIFDIKEERRALNYQFDFRIQRAAERASKDDIARIINGKIGPECG